MSDMSDAMVNKIEQKLESISKAIGSIEEMNRKIHALEADLQKTVADARSLAEGTRVNQDTVNNAIREIGDRYAALEKTIADLKRSQEALAVAVKRPHVANLASEEDGGLRERAEMLHKSILSRAQRLELSNVRMPDNFVEIAKAYEESFHYAIRFDWKMQLRGDIEKNLQIGNDPAAGYLVPPAMASQILSIVHETTPMAELASSMTLAGPTLTFPTDDDEAEAGWVGETQSRPDTATPTVGEQSIQVHEIYANVRASQSFLEDAGIDVERWLGAKVGERFSRKEAQAFTVGDGVKKPRGILSYPHGTGRGYIEQIPTGNASNITADAIVKMPYMLKSAYTANATWLMSRFTLAQVALLKDSNNQYLWRMGLENGRPSLLVGYPVRTGEDVPPIAPNALCYVFGDFRRAYMIVRRLGISMLRDPYTGTPFVRFYFRARVGGDVVNFEAVKIGRVST